MSIFSVFLAILALSFLIFIHELGHYFMARRVGMKVETFSIGFGKPILSWEFQGVKWQIGWLLFGGFVKIAGTDSEKDPDPYLVKDGFFGKSPWDRIKVAFMGPFVNIVFALLAFSLLWVSGGREKPFSEFTTRLGSIDASSDLYKNGIRPGDEIFAYNGKRYKGIQDLMYVALTSSGPILVEGEKINYETLEKTPFSLSVNPYPRPGSIDKSIMTTGVLSPANYLIYDRLPGGGENPLPENSPMQKSGLQYGDRIVWMDGHRVFSLLELSNLLNDGRVLLTVERNGEKKFFRVPRIFVEELKLDAPFKDEVSDWQYEAGLKDVKFSKLYMIPYNLTNDAVVENKMDFIDKESEKGAFPDLPFSSLEEPLLPGDKIVAIEGEPVTKSQDLLKDLQEKNVFIIVQRGLALPKGQRSKISWRDADLAFDKSLDEKELHKLEQALMAGEKESSAGDLVLLPRVTPQTHEMIYSGTSSDSFALVAKEIEAQRRQIELIEDGEKKEEILKAFDQRLKRLELGVPVTDLKVEYNPVPTDQFANVFSEIARTLKALVTGSLNPKWMSGPVGIVHMFNEQTKTSVGETLFWLGTISLNLGMLNLLPIPMLDGGTIVLSFFEMVTGRKIKPKTLEKVILPFALILIGFFVFLTFNDIFRIFGGFWK